jgi:hypothetical protein
LNAFNNNTELRIEVRLNNFVIQTVRLLVFFSLSIISFFYHQAPSFWTNISFVGVPEYPTYNSKEVIQSTRTLLAFRSFLATQLFPFEYDHAFGLFE